MVALLALAMAEPLALGESTVADIDGEPVSWTLDVTEPGLLSVAVRAHGELDLVIDVLDEDGQRVPAGHADDDLDDDRGAEQLAVALPWPGTYQVRVSDIRRLDGNSFAMSAGFVPMEAVGLPDVTHYRPGLAQTLTTSQAVSGHLDSTDKQAHQWVRFDPTAERTVTFNVDSERGDLVLEQFLATDFIEPAEVSDQDLDGRLAKERLTLATVPGTPVWLRVRDRGSSGALDYLITAE